MRQQPNIKNDKKCWRVANEQHQLIIFEPHCNQAEENFTDSIKTIKACAKHCSHLGRDELQPDDIRCAVNCGANEAVKKLKASEHVEAGGKYPKDAEDAASQATDNQNRFSSIALKVKTVMSRLAIFTLPLHSPVR